jgi:ABC-type glycerol-3-phosphate transport system substrate-binding protein
MKSLLALLVLGAALAVGACNSTTTSSAPSISVPTTIPVVSPSDIPSASPS